MTRALAGLMALSALLSAADGPKRPFETSETRHWSFQPGGVIELRRSYGYLTVEGWDEPEVEITITKSTDRFYKPEQKDKAERHFEEIQVATERRSDGDLAISTTLPIRSGLLHSILPAERFLVTMPVRSRRGITVEYTVHVPRDSRLVIQHDSGYVWVSDVSGDIDVRSHTGDMIVMLPDAGPYAIDAKTRLGSVLSDFAGKGGWQFPLGAHFAEPVRPARRVYLRMGRGSITIKNGPASGPFWKN